MVWIKSHNLFSLYGTSSGNSTNVLLTICEFPYLHTYIDMMQLSLKKIIAAAILLDGVASIVLVALSEEKPISSVLNKRQDLVVDKAITSLPTITRGKAHPSHPVIAPRVDPGYHFTDHAAKNNPYLTIYKNRDDFSVAWGHNKKNTNGMGFIAANLDESTKHFKLALTYDGEDRSSGWWGLIVQHEGGGGWVVLKPGEIAIMGNFKHSDTLNNGSVQYNAAFRAQYCDDGGHNCIGNENHCNLLEWSIMKESGLLNFNHGFGMNSSPILMTLVNLETVDAFNMPIFIASLEGTSCHPCPNINCQIPANIITQKCPKDHTTGNNDHPICVSDCKLYGNAQYCCKGYYDNINTCPPSNGYLKNYCEFSYAYPHDDHMYTHKCNPNGFLIAYLGLSDQRLDLDST
jgi:hypothetical protein